ncbi:MAG: integrase core domain-containing protein [Elusimicrobiota bacterium]
MKSLQSDNGSENLGEFDLELKREGIEHKFTYPRCPRINSYIERYNRTIQEEFIDNNLDIMHDKELLNKKLAEYLSACNAQADLIYYNIERPHKSLNMKAPLELILKDKMSQMCVTHTKT